MREMFILSNTIWQLKPSANGSNSLDGLQKELHPLERDICN